jgi:hypothetical protein
MGVDVVGAGIMGFGIMGSVIMVGAGMAGCEAVDVAYPIPLMLMLPPQPANKTPAAATT